MIQISELTLMKCFSSWFNNHVKSNPQQQQAVRNILLATSYPAPYLIYGPPGTGKTVTVVEAITQVSLRKVLFKEVATYS
jgi:superfamily II DNA or RNA helicase